jgi:hypothetical protein
VCGRAPAVIVAQNVLMHKVGIIQGQHLESKDFEAYLSLFKHGLTEAQVQMIKVLFQGAVPDTFLATAGEL